MLRSMPRIAFRLWLKDDPVGIETYVKWHLEPFDGLYDLIRAAGIERYTIWLDGTDLLLTREGATPELGEKLDLENPVHKEWAATMTPLFQPRVAESGATKPAQVFAFQPDGERGPAAGQMTYRAGVKPGAAHTGPVAQAWSAQASVVSEALRASGVHRAWVWSEDGSLWAYVEAASSEGAEAALMADPAWGAFWGSIAPHLDGGSARDGWRRTREVFRCD